MCCSRACLTSQFGRRVCLWYWSCPSYFPLFCRFFYIILTGCRSCQYRCEKTTLWVPITVVDTVCACRCCCCCCYWFINFKCCFFLECVLCTTSKCAYHVHFKGRPLDNQVNKYCQCQSRWRYEKCHLFLTLKICVRIFCSSVLTYFTRKHQPDWVWVGGFVCRVLFVCLE